MAIIKMIIVTIFDTLSSASTFTGGNPFFAGGCFCAYDFLLRGFGLTLLFRFLLIIH